MLHYLIVLFLLWVSLEADSKKDGFLHLNNLREEAGLIRLKSNKILDNAATSHAKYLIQNQTKTHYEKKGKHVFSGVAPSHRVIKAGYPSTYVMENLSINTENYVRSIDNLFSAIYHRFVFLNLDKDEIGLGSAISKKKRKINRAFVYDLGSSGIAELCKNTFSMVHGAYYMKNICKQADKMVPQLLFEEKKDLIRGQNRDIILYPYAGQNEIWPAFYNESPDPLPGYKVSGFPISVQFNPSFFKHIELKSFRLFNENEKEITKTRLLTKNSDLNHLFTKFEFALMPLKRLEFDAKYKVLFEAVADGKKVKKRWEFRTTNPQKRLYTIREKRSRLSVEAGSTVLLYIVPTSKKDIIHHYRARGDLKVSFLDQNTLEVTFPKRVASGKIGLDIGERKILFDLQ